ncbi:hypothetical protein DCAR_0521732 [Daucus carota subsp. sativus]|uniref:Replication protein A 70 kDa DNA-binding subunit B/D first OB fold domain-containing protein n=1 Tax=Daucus carota subsp. sativus TaxID=79200 RepID=A0AAF0X6N1_DAUCS|nr:hypothetical protein DCAR_0521732 [Daucus carota subsp. sativus]
MDKALYSFDSLEDIEDSRTDWKVRVKSQSIWKGINRKTGEFKGYNIVFFDDYSTRVHAFISSQIVPQFEDLLTEEQMYLITNFKVLFYNGDETNRPVRTEKHIYFTSDTVMVKETVSGLKFPNYSFDMRNLEEMEVIKKDNRFLIDVVAVVESVQEKAVYMKDAVEKSHVAFTISDGRYRQPGFYVMDIEEEEEVLELPQMKIKELRDLNESFVQVPEVKKVTCQVTLKRFDEKQNWYSAYCIKCEKDLDMVDGNYNCCGRNYPYPDKRFRLYGLCSDETGTVPIVWPDEEISRLTGKTVYDVDADDDEVDVKNKIPDILKSLEKKQYRLDILLTEENVKQGSNVYNATKISKPLEITDNHDPNPNVHVVNEQTEITNDISKEPTSNINSPATEKSTNKTKSRLKADIIETPIKKPDLKKVKLEKMSTNACDSLRNINSSRADWKVKARVIRQWRGSTNSGIVFKSYNILLLDAKNCRMHVFIPAAIADKMSRIIEEGKIYLIKNFTVKDFTEKDNYRVVHMDKQISFTTETRVKELDDSEIFIPTNNFDLFQFSDLKSQATQDVYLTDVIGIIKSKEEISRIPNKQVKVKFVITDGSKNVNVTFWKSFAEEFEQAMSEELQQPVTIIIASARVTQYKDQIDLCNYSPTKYYLNYEHHSVGKMRKLLEDPNFSNSNLGRIKKEVTTFNIDQTSAKTTTRFHITTVVADNTGELKVVLKDREIRNLIHKYVEEVDSEDDSFPEAVRSIQGMQCSFQLFVTANNVEEKSSKFMATKIIKGFNTEEDVAEQEQTLETMENLGSQEWTCG